MKRSARAPGVLLLLAAFGCGSPTPSLHPVKGMVHYKDGEPVAGGFIEFRPSADPGQASIGDIGPGGFFELATLHNGRRQPGAPEGAYQVTVYPPMGQDQSGEAIPLAQTFRVEPRDNDFKIEVEKPRLRH